MLVWDLISAVLYCHTYAPTCSIIAHKDLFKSKMSFWLQSLIYGGVWPRKYQRPPSHCAHFLCSEIVSFLSLSFVFLSVPHSFSVIWTTPEFLSLFFFLFLGLVHPVYQKKTKTKEKQYFLTYLHKIIWSWACRLASHSQSKDNIWRVTWWKKGKIIYRNKFFFLFLFLSEVLKYWIVSSPQAF